MKRFNPLSYVKTHTSIPQFENTVLSQIAKVVSTFFFVGFIPVIPGTFGSLASLSLYFVLLHFAQWPAYLASIILVIGLGVWAAGRAERETRIVDPSFVVIDEVAGQLITLFLIPFTWSHLIAGFLIFRLFDILKPFPAGRAEKLPGGWGIMLDDVLAGVYGNLLLRLLIYLCGLWGLCGSKTL